MCFQMKSICIVGKHVSVFCLVTITQITKFTGNSRMNRQELPKEISRTKMLLYFVLDVKCSALKLDY